MAAQSDADPAAAAAAARDGLGIGPTGPVPDAIAAVEAELGVPVAILDMGQGIAGAYIVRRARPFILVNGKDSKYRRRFTISHELGHHVLGHAEVVDNVETIDGHTTDPRERDANQFAGEFLAPDAALAAVMADAGDPKLNINAVVYIANFFGISPPAAFVRLKQAGILVRADQSRQIKLALDRGQHRGAAEALGLDPFEDSLTRIGRDELPRLPAIMTENALSAYTSGLLDLDQLASKLGRSTVEVEEMLSELGIQASASGDDDW